MARGRPAKTTHADRVLIRELFRVGRTGPKPMSVDEIAAKFSVSTETIYRVVRLDEIEMEQRRADEECCCKR